jgi:hypothetical protein
MKKVIIMGLALVTLSMLSLTVAAVTVTEAQTDSNIIVLSHRFETDGLPKIIGEVQNNSTRTYDKFDVDIVVNFRDAAGTLIISEEGYIDAETLSPGDSSAFQAISFDESLPDTASTYDVIVDDDRVVVGAPLEGDSSDSDSDSEGEESGNN